MIFANKIITMEYIISNKIFSIINMKKPEGFFGSLFEFEGVNFPLLAQRSSPTSAEMRTPTSPY